MVAEEIEKAAAASDHKTASASSHYEGKPENRELAADHAGRRQRRATWRLLGAASRAAIIRWRRESGIDAGVSCVVTSKCEDSSPSVLIGIGVSGRIVAGILAGEHQPVRQLVESDLVVPCWQFLKVVVTTR